MKGGAVEQKNKEKTLVSSSKALIRFSSLYICSSFTVQQFVGNGSLDYSVSKLHSKVLIDCCKL